MNKKIMLAIFSMVILTQAPLFGATDQENAGSSYGSASSQQTEEQGYYGRHRRGGYDRRRNYRGYGRGRRRGEWHHRKMGSLQKQIDDLKTKFDALQKQVNDFHSK